MAGNWSWIEMCGPGGLVPWYPTKHDIGSCFQQIFLLVPVLILFAIVSAYCYGSRTDSRITFRHQKRILQLRFTFSLLIALLPVVKLIVGIEYSFGVSRPVDYLTAGVEIIAWSVHSVYVLSLRHNSRLHGPVIVRVLWTLLVIMAIINLRTQILISHSESDFIYHIKLGFSIGLVILHMCYGLSFLYCAEMSLSELNSRQNQLNERSPLLGSSVYHGFMEDVDPGYLGVAMENESFTSKLIFYWVYPLMKKGCDKKLETCDDLFDLPNSMNTSFLCRKLHSALGSTPTMEKETRSYGATDVAILPKPEKVTLFKALHMCFGIEFYAIGLLKLSSDLLAFGGPILLNKLVNFIEDKNQKMEVGYLCAFGLFATTFFGALTNVHFRFYIIKVGLKLRGALISTVYRKMLSTVYLDLNKFTMGEIANFMSTDVDRIVNSCASFHSVWSIPLQLLLTFYFLYEQVGVAFLAGVIFTVILIPINKAIASKIGRISVKLMEQKDQRVSATAEMLLGVRVLKMHVWEQYFLERICRIRDSEVKHLKARKYLDALCVYFWATTPILISIFTFATYSLLGNQLTAATVFTTLALLNMLIAPLNAFPWILNGLTEAWVSLTRIQRLMDAKDNNFREYFESNPINKKDVFVLEHCSFQWETQEEKKTEEDRPGNSGETSGQAENLVINDSDVSSSWDVETPSTSTKHHFVLENVNLTIQEGQLVGVIGPLGSGKSTLLAALTGEINKVEGTISMSNIEGGCALVTQTPWLQRGTIRENILLGKSYDNLWYKNVLEACCLTQDLENLQGGDLARVGDGGMTLSGGQRARLALARAVYQNRDIYLLDDVLASVDVHVARFLYNRVICGLLKQKTRIMVTNQIQLLVNADKIVKLNKGIVEAVGKPSDILTDFEELNHFDMESTSPTKMYEARPENLQGSVDTDPEVSERGSINTKVYKQYWTSIGHFLALIILFSMVLMQATRNVTDWWLSFWVTQESKLNGSEYTVQAGKLKHYALSVYSALAVMNTLATLMRAFLFAYGSIQAAIAIHEKLLKKILSSKIVFFDISPMGRILNRFSSDTYAIDDSLPFILNIFLAQFFCLLGTLVITTYGLPWLCLVLAPLVPIYHHIQMTYRSTSRELKRLSSTSLSPVFSHFTETLQGLTTIRAFRFKQINDEILECNQKAIFASQSANQWLNFHLQMIGVVLITGVGVIASLQHEFDAVDSAIVGLTISYALSTLSLLNGVVSSFTEMETEMISMERVGQYLDEVESEPEEGKSPPYGWFSQGVIVFQGVYLKYREHIPLSLNGVSFETRPAEKVGVVGRTGAGKSSLIVALLRLVSISSGKILIDAVNIGQISLQALRSRISVIPQDPFLFEGSVRVNIDPLGEYTDLEIMSALQKCHMKDVVNNLGGLNAKINSGGKNFSQGERQLLCLARAVLRNAKIVCIDEATAFVDTESDKKIQHTIRSAFRQSTVLTIAHRISTVMDCDRILVLNDGEVVEFDSPKTLALDETSYFYQLCQQEIK
ncbi:hypothetical protein RUM44_013862 [Polyplax serrata]|uniref:Multidrug resistance-associated protein 7 n=1 Tax=Polyplax serrata TaxID=468196 RepID=A0ABR1BH86_POLSC